MKAEVKAALDGDVTIKQFLQDMLKDGASPSMPAPMRAFITFLVAD